MNDEILEKPEHDGVPEEAKPYMDLNPHPTAIIDRVTKDIIYRNTAGLHVIPEDYDIKPIVASLESETQETMPYSLVFENQDGESRQYYYMLTPVPKREQYMFTLIDVAEHGFQTEVLESIIKQSRDTFAIARPDKNWSILYNTIEGFIHPDQQGFTAKDRMKSFIERIPKNDSNEQLIDFLTNLDLDALKNELLMDGPKSIKLPQKEGDALTWYRVRLIPIPDETKNDLKYIGFVMQDITDIVKLGETGELSLGEEDYSPEKIILSLVDTVNDIKALFGMFAHELRSPLSSLNMSTYKLKKYATDTQSREEIAEGIERTIKGISRRLDDIETLSKGKSIELNPNYNNLKQVKEFLIAEFEEDEDQALSINIINDENKDVTAYFDFSRLSHMLSKLIENGFKYSHNQPVTVNMMPQQDDLIMEVIDRGIGIPEEEREKIFRLNYRAANTAAYNGKGIGLAFVKQIVDAHEGSISIDSVENKGTRFTIKIPQPKDN